MKEGENMACKSKSKGSKKGKVGKQKGGGPSISLQAYVNVLFCESRCDMFKWLRQLLCDHEPHGGLRSEKVAKHKKRHYYECKKCNKRVYVDQSQRYGLFLCPEHDVKPFKL